MENYFKEKTVLYDEEVVNEEYTNSINLLLEGNSEKEIKKKYKLKIIFLILLLILKKK